MSLIYTHVLKKHAIVFFFSSYNLLKTLVFLCYFLYDLEEIDIDLSRNTLK